MKNKMASRRRLGDSTATPAILENADNEEDVEKINHSEIASICDKLIRHHLIYGDKFEWIRAGTTRKLTLGRERSFESALTGCTCSKRCSTSQSFFADAGTIVPQQPAEFRERKPEEE